MEEEKKTEEEQEEPSEAEETEVEEKVDEAPEEETEENKEEQVSGEEETEEVKGEEGAEEKGAVEETAEAEAQGEEAPAPVEEEEAKPPREKKVEEEEIVEEKVYTIPLGKAWIMPSNRRASRAVRMIREFVVKNMKLEKPKGEEVEEEDPKKLVLSGEVNDRVWSRGMQKPPRNIRVRAAKDKDGNVTVYLAEGD
jgi:large subunit ribosomal protein L31e